MKLAVSNNAKLILEEMLYGEIVCVKNDSGNIVEARTTGAGARNIAPHYVYELLKYDYIEQLDYLDSDIVKYKISKKGKKAL